MVRFIKMLGFGAASGGRISQAGPSARSLTGEKLSERLLHIAGYMWRKEGVRGGENVSVKLPTAAASFQSKHS